MVGLGCVVLMAADAPSSPARETVAAKSVQLVDDTGSGFMASVR